MRLFLEYSWRLLSQWKYFYGFITFGLVTLSTLSLSGTNLLLPTWFWLLGLFISLYLGSFGVYKQVVAQLPKPAELTIVCTSVIFTTRSSSGGIPNSPLRFRINLDLINRGEEPATLKELKVTKFNMKTVLLGSKPLDGAKLFRANMPHGRGEIHLPYIVPSLHREPSLELEIEVELLDREPLSFAKQLGNLKDFEIELDYAYEDMRRVLHSDKVLIADSFSGFKDRMIQEWKQMNRDDLVVEANGL